MEYGGDMTDEKVIVTKKVIAEQIASRHGLSKIESKLIVDDVFECIAEALKRGDTVNISGFGRFEIQTRAKRMGINPATLEKIEIQESVLPRFKASKSLKEFIEK